jgi:protein ATS1
MATRLYALGSNASGQLGIGHHEDVDLPTPCQFILDPERDGSSSVKDHLRASRDLPSHVRKIVAGGNHTLVLCDNGAVYAAGDAEALGKVVDPASQDPGLHLSDSQELAPYFGRVMWWEGTKLLDTFIDISATWSASFFVVEPEIQDGYVVRSGKIYACGRGEKGELGAGKGVNETKRPRLVAVFGSKESPEYTTNNLEDVPLIPGPLAGIWSSVACTVTCSTDGVHVFGWGNCRKGQLGDSLRERKVVWEPTRIAETDMKQNVDLDRVFTAAVGKDFILLQGSHGTQESRVRRWRLLGGNSFLKSDGDDVRDFIADLTFPLPAGETMSLGTSPFASWSNIYVIDARTHRVKALGRNDHGQLPPKELPEVCQMSAGSEHCVALTSQGRAVTWGWGEHGNCGRKSDEKGQGWGMLNLPIVGAERITGVGAGCATTFLWTAEK